MYPHILHPLNAELVNFKYVYQSRPTTPGQSTSSKSRRLRSEDTGDVETNDKVKEYFVEILLKL